MPRRRSLPRRRPREPLADEIGNRHRRGAVESRPHRRPGTVLPRQAQAGRRVADRGRIQARREDDCTSATTRPARGRARRSGDRRRRLPGIAAAPRRCGRVAQNVSDSASSRSATMRTSGRISSGRGHAGRDPRSPRAGAGRRCRPSTIPPAVSAARGQRPGGPPRPGRRRRQAVVAAADDDRVIVGHGTAFCRRCSRRSSSAAIRPGAPIDAAAWMGARSAHPQALDGVRYRAQPGTGRLKKSCSSDSSPWKMLPSVRPIRRSMSSGVSTWRPTMVADVGRRSAIVSITVSPNALAGRVAHVAPRPGGTARTGRSNS